MSQNAAVIICTRPESRRLPRKAFKRIVGIPAIEHILKRIQGCGLPVILAVPHGCSEYDALAERYGATIFTGNPESPLHRMNDAVQVLSTALPIQYVVRITHDDILIDKDTMLRLVDQCAIRRAGYGFSPEIVEGAGVEVIHVDNLREAAMLNGPTEFISYFVKNGPHKEQVHIQPREGIRRDYRLTMDYPEDAVLLETLLRAVGPDASLDMIVDHLDRNPYLLCLNRQPLITFYTCAYNAEAYLDETMASVLRNSTTHCEYLLIDDGSTDRTLEVAARYAWHPNLKIVVNDQNMGLASSSNKAVDMARGRYIMRVDADDALSPGSVTKMIAKMKQTHAGVVYAAYKETDANGVVKKQLCRPQTTHHAGCALMDKRLLNEIRFTDSIRHFDSVDLYNRLKDKAPIAYHDEALWFYRRHDKNMSLPSPERDATRAALGISDGYTTTSSALRNGRLA